MTNVRVGIISDTHGRLPATVFELFAGVDHILHAGDIGDPDILAELRTIAPLTAVAGNIDGFVCGDAVEEARVTIGGLRFYITHILDRPSPMRPEVADTLRRDPADVVIFGHSHLPHDEKVEGLWFFNPASAGPRRFDYPTSVGMFQKSDGRWTSRHIPLDPRSEGALAKYMNQLSSR